MVIIRKEECYLCCQCRIFTVFTYSQLPSTECCSAISFSMRKNGYIKFTFNGTVVCIPKSVCIGPVSHKQGISSLPYFSGSFFIHRKHTFWSNGSNPACYLFQHFCRVFVGNGNFLVSVYNGSTVVGCNPFQCITCKAFIGISLEYKTPKIRIIFLFAGHDNFCHFFKFIPCFRRTIKTVLLK